jgi:hypothetical protein
MIEGFFEAALVERTSRTTPNVAVSLLIQRYTVIPASEIKNEMDRLDKEGYESKEKYKRLADYVVKETKFITGNDDQMFKGEIGDALTQEEISECLGLTGTAMQLYRKSNDRRVIEHRERNPKYWTTDFKPLSRLQRGDVYTVNHFHFDTPENASYFCGQIKGSLDKAKIYPHNHEEKISEPERPNEKTVIIIYGKERINE